jgi:succinate dehydrogenase flavin-adding protein (antitoxin of CptAB toxin-antitoxin module)
MRLHCVPDSMIGEKDWLLIFVPMRFVFPMLLMCGLLFTACPSPETQPKSGEDSLACAGLDELMLRLSEVNQMLEDGEEWESCKTHLSNVVELMDQNMQQPEERCHYLNQHNYPERPRFVFVETLSDRIRKDTLAGGLYFYVRLRGIFGDDAAISEYFSEELAHLALNSPDSYLRYLQSNPDQEVMLLYSTKWNFLDADTLIQRFSRRQGSEAVVDYLKEWKVKYNTGSN